MRGTTDPSMQSCRCATAAAITWPTTRQNNRCQGRQLAKDAAKAEEFAKIAAEQAAAEQAKAEAAAAEEARLAAEEEARLKAE